MNITIKRISKKGQAIDGTLYIDGLRICDTAENAEYCLNPGTYPVVRHKCTFRGRNVPAIVLPTESKDTICNRCMVCKKPSCVCNNSTPHKGGDGGGLLFCPQITMGNGVYNRKDGSILVGTCIVPGCLKHIKEPFENICERLRKLDDRGSEVTLTIIDQIPEPVSPTLTPYKMGEQILNQMHTRKLACE